MGDAMQLPNNARALDLLIDWIHEQKFPIFASPEDADYFRKALPKKQPPKEPPKLEFTSPVIQVNSGGSQSGPDLNHQKEGCVASIQKAGDDSKRGRSDGPPNSPNLTARGIEKQSAPKTFFDLSSLKNVLSIAVPELAILNEIPSDATAQKISERWKTKNQSAPISILVFQEPAEQRIFLEQIAKALDIYFGPAKIVQAEGIEKEKQWGAFLSVADLKMVVVCDYTLWQLNALLQFYKETQAQGSRLLGTVPVFLLPDLSLYLKDPLLKRSLWRAFCQKFS